MRTELTNQVLTNRLAELLSKERLATVDFVTCLCEFDRRQIYLELGFSSLFDYCTKALHLPNAIRPTICAFYADVIISGAHKRRSAKTS